MENKLSDLTNALLDEAKKAGANTADVIAVTSASISVDVLKGHLEHIERSETTEIGLRVILNKKQACVSSSLVDRVSLKTIAERAVAMAREAIVDPFIGLASPSEVAKEWNLDDLQLYDNNTKLKPEELEKLALRAERAALKINGISKSQSTSAFYGEQNIHLRATNGFSGGYKKSHSGVFCSAIAGDGLGMERDGFGDARTHRSDLISPEEIGKTAGERAVKKLNSRKPKTGNFPVLFDERISNSLIGHLLSAINGRAIVQGASWASELLGKPIFPKGTSLVEDPHRARSYGSRPFDGEGLPTLKRTIIKDGHLNEWTLDLATARQLGETSTANASRGVSSPPTPSISNVILSKGESSFNTLIKEMHTGLLVTSMIGSTINQNTGDYSRGVSGFWVENGEISYPINECTIAGNLKEMFQSMIAGNDSKPYRSIVVPSLLIEGLTIAGQ